MIFGNSNDPVLIKKISLKIWLLKDEVEAVTKTSYSQFEDKEKLKSLLTEEYNPQNSRGKLELVKEESTKKESDSEAKDDDSQKSKQVIQRKSINIDPEKVSNAVVVLSEVEMNKIHFFCSKNFSIGQTIVIEFQIPQKFSITSEIIYCHSFNMRNNIIGKNKHSFRIVAKYSFLKIGERTLLRNFISSIEPEVVKPVKTSNIDTTSNDNFDELDGLDL